MNPEFYPPRRGASSPNLAHRARGTDETRLVDTVLQLFVPDGEAEEIRNFRTCATVSQRPFHVPLAAREQARAQLSVGGDADPVAAGAERLRDRVDEADLALPVGETEPPGGRRQLGRNLDERPVLRFDQGADLAAGQHLVGAPRAVCVERHELDEADDVRLAAREPGERGNLFLRESLDRDAVQLDRTELRIA